MEYQGRKRKHESSSSLSDEYPKFQKARLLSDNSDISEVSENESNSPMTMSAPYASFLQNDADFSTSSYGHTSLSDSDSTGEEATNHHEGGMGSYTAPLQGDGEANYSEFAQRQMASMGYKAGKGLGKFDQGRAGIVEASTQRGRRGLGFVIKGLDDEEIEWEEDAEVEMQELIEWIPSCSQPPPQQDELENWSSIGEKKLTIDDEIQFCDSKVLEDILRCKTVFDALAGEEFLKARTRANPHEFIRGAIFQNRAAMKMANIEAAFDFMLTSPKNEHGQELLSANDLLFFADLCAGPGGFSEYVLWRRGWTAKGFGFTLKGNNDFKLEEFLAGTPETFEPLYGTEDDGDIYKSSNLVDFKNHVMNATDGKGVHFVMADGGFSVEGQENIQEILSKQLYLCQFLCAMSILRQGGCFMCKLFDLFTPFSMGLVYLTYRAFDEVCIFKPVTSRPANSERYIICKGWRTDTQDVHDYLFNINVKINRLKEKHSNEDVMEIVPVQLIKDDKAFFEYMKESNNRLGKRQVRALLKLRAYVQDTNLVGPNQADVRRECLKLWKIPDVARAAARHSDAEARFHELWKGFDDEECFGHEVVSLSQEYLHELKNVYDYKCIVLGGERCFLLGLGRSNVYRWDGKPKTRSQRWSKVESISLELPKDTLIEVDLVYEMRGEGKGQRKALAVHIIDAVLLGGRDVRDKHYQERMGVAGVFVKAISKPSRGDLVPIRVKQTFRPENLDRIFSRLQQKIVKGIQRPKECYLLDNGKHFIPRGIFFIKHNKDPWSQNLSKTHRRFYFYNASTRESKFERPKESVASFKSCLTERYFWSWEGDQECRLERETVLQFILKNSNQILHGK